MKGKEKTKETRESVKNRYDKMFNVQSIETYTYHRIQLYKKEKDNLSNNVDKKFEFDCRIIISWYSL